MAREVCCLSDRFREQARSHSLKCIPVWERAGSGRRSDEGVGTANEDKKG
jgi:hypothetical protein